MRTDQGEVGSEVREGGVAIGVDPLANGRQVHRVGHDAGVAQLSRCVYRPVEDLHGNDRGAVAERLQFNYCSAVTAQPLPGQRVKTQRAAHHGGSHLVGVAGSHGVEDRAEHAVETLRARVAQRALID